MLFGWLKIIVWLYSWIAEGQTYASGLLVSYFNLLISKLDVRTCQENIMESS